MAGRHAVLRLFVVWVVTAVTLFVLSSLISEIDIPGWGFAFATAALIGLLNAVVWPLFVRLALPITVLTLGVAALLLNGFIVWMASSGLMRCRCCARSTFIITICGSTLSDSCMLLPFTTICPDQSPVNVVPVRDGPGREEEMRLDVVG